jgi:regulator of protease activity HflC (stomatin/prohibitin superfamily)
MIAARPRPRDAETVGLARAGPRRIERPRMRRAALLGALALLVGGGGCATVPAGYTGVLFTSSGVDPHPLGEGVSVIGPLSSVELYDLRVLTRAEDLAAIAADGAPLVARTSLVGFHVVPGEVVALHREVGPEYYGRVVRPIVRAAVRRVLSGYRSDEITAARVASIQNQIRKVIALHLHPFHLVVDSLDLRNLAVDYSPKSYSVVLETGVLEQSVLATPQLLAIARRRADERRAEARGVQAQHELVGPGLTSKTLAHAAIHAFGELLAAPSTSVVSGAGATALEVQ